VANSKPDLSTALWHTSSYSNSSGGDCVEVATNLPATVPVRDTKLAGVGPTLTFGPGAWTTFLTATQPRWNTSSHSNASGGDCVEVATNLPGFIPVRDTKHHGTGPTIRLRRSSWAAFVGAVSV
jgi:hypothetical protein